MMLGCSREVIWHAEAAGPLSQAARAANYFGTPTFVPWIENFIGDIRSCEREIVLRGLATE